MNLAHMWDAGAKGKQTGRGSVGYTKVMVPVSQLLSVYCTAVRKLKGKYALALFFLSYVLISNKYLAPKYHLSVYCQTNLAIQFLFFFISFLIAVIFYFSPVLFIVKNCSMGSMISLQHLHLVFSSQFLAATTSFTAADY